MVVLAHLREIDTSWQAPIYSRCRTPFTQLFCLRQLLLFMPRQSCMCTRGCAESVGRLLRCCCFGVCVFFRQTPSIAIGWSAQEGGEIPARYCTPGVPPSLGCVVGCCYGGVLYVPFRRKRDLPGAVTVILVVVVVSVAVRDLLLRYELLPVSSLSLLLCTSRLFFCCLL